MCVINVCTASIDNLNRLMQRLNEQFLSPKVSRIQNLHQLSASISKSNTQQQSLHPQLSRHVQIHQKKPSLTQFSFQMSPTITHWYIAGVHTIQLILSANLPALVISGTELHTLAIWYNQHNGSFDHSM